MKIITIGGDVKNIEMFLRNKLSESKSEYDDNNIIIVDMDMGEETREICEHFCRDHSQFILIDNWNDCSILLDNIIYEQYHEKD